MPIETLIGRQNPDGGWPYIRGGSWTEPTVYAVLALLGAGERVAAGRGLGWIASSVRPDGGWAPRGSVDESTWVTGLVALLPPGRLGPGRYEGAIRWLVRTTGHESEFSYRLREFLRGESPSPEQKFSGWPWVPGAAAWVGPTSIAILALQQAAHHGESAALVERLDSGRQFLLSRTCQEGGWNHGAAQALGYAAHPYPETTGMALLALGGVKSAKVDRALTVALQFLAECRSADALNWLRLGLMAHGRMPPDYRPAAVAYRTTPEISLELLVEAGKGNPLLGA
jgi:hypothetical protein